ncbi:KilA-N domain-containing protein [Vibrio rotiferianus]|uniref:KilA-N domain-containing protein n=1 Tax=Vibrio rotiferianus TaxID=190895 RepID=UPI003980D59E
MTNLTILSKDIRTLDGLYSLNDLHKASGAAKKHQPAIYMQNQQTKQLIIEVESDLGIPRSVKTMRGGRDKGTWVCKELVYAYAMWISAKFHLQVIRAFDAMVQNELAIPSPDSVTLSAKQASFLACTFRMMDKLEVRYQSTRENIQSMQTQVAMMRTLCDNMDSEINNLQSQLSGDFDVINHVHLYKKMVMDYQGNDEMKRFLRNGQ